jgi:hypothetical protein
MNPVFPIPNCRVEQIRQRGSAGLRVLAQGLKPEAACPICFTVSQAVHSRYYRHPTDLPSLGQPVQLVLCVRRFYCRNGTCPRRTFVEPLPDLLAPRACRTRRLALTQGKIGVACGGEAGARLPTDLSMPIRGDTVLRLIRALPLSAIGAPEVLGVDDWARRKGQTYGTLVVDLKERRVIDLLPDRTAATLANWLKERPTVQIITRDRSAEYARGAAMGAPQAVQVADRWHLLYNLRQMLARWLTSIHGRLRCLPALPGEAPPGRRTRPYPRSRTEIAARAEHRARSVALQQF